MGQKWVIRETGHMGKGIYAAQMIQQGQTILQEDVQNFIIFDHILQYLEFQEAERQGRLEQIDKKVLFAFFLTARSVDIDVRNKEEDDSQEESERRKIKKYLQKIPKVMHSLICWTQNQLQQLDNRQLLIRILMRRLYILIDFWKFWYIVGEYFSRRDIIGVRLIKNRQIHKKITSKLFLYFYAVMESRTVHYETSEDHKSYIGALAPTIQMINHSNNPNCDVKPGARFRVIAMQKIAKGQEIYVKYAHLKDDYSLQTYGFLLNQGPIQETDPQYRVKVAQIYSQRNRMRKSHERQVIKNGDNEIETNGKILRYKKDQNIMKNGDGKFV